MDEIIKATLHRSAVKHGSGAKIINLDRCKNVHNRNPNILAFHKLGLKCFCSSLNDYDNAIRDRMAVNIQICAQIQLKDR